MPKEEISWLVEWIKTIGYVVISVGLVVFAWGIGWQKISDFRDKVNKQGDKLATLENNIAELKKNLGDLGATPYEIEVSSDGGAGICELGGVVIGIIRENQRILVRCASVGRAAWNPNPFTPGSIDPNLYLLKAANPHQPGGSVLSSAPSHAGSEQN
jgi:hypothetical protein